MKHILFTILCFSFMLFQSCTAVLLTGFSLHEEMQDYIYYLGEARDSTGNLEVYFDQFAVSKEYVIMGTLTNRATSAYKKTEDWKNAFITRAKQEGGEGIIFDPIQLSFNPECSRCLMLNAKVIRYVPPKQKSEIMPK